MSIQLEELRPATNLLFILSSLFFPDVFLVQKLSGFIQVFKVSQVQVNLQGIEADFCRDCRVDDGHRAQARGGASKPSSV